MARSRFVWLGFWLYGLSLGFLQGAEVLAKLEARLSEAESVAGLNELVRDHFASTRELARFAWAQAQADPALREQTQGFLETMLRGLDDDAARPETYVKAGKRSLLFAYRNPLDQSLQYYACKLPVDFDPKRAYPLIVSLHGRGPDHFLAYAYIHYGIPKDLDAYAHPKRYSRDFILIFPWAHGNLGYDDPRAEQDVRLAMADCKKRFLIDEDRQYLEGHSMGGFGVWRLGARYAADWAALLMVAGGYREGQAPLAATLAKLPVRLWHGQNDPAVPVGCSYQMAGALEAHGGKPELIVVPDWGHEQPRGAARDENIEWLLRHSRAP